MANVDSEDANAPIWDLLRGRTPCLWTNPEGHGLEAGDDPLAAAVLAAEARLARAAPLMRRLFPDLSPDIGFDDSPLLDAEAFYAAPEVPRLGRGRFLVKADHALPLAGSIKARGGFHEVLAFAEKLAARHGLVAEEGDLIALASPAAKALFSRHTISVGSTGNLGLGIGVMASALGFRAVVHMSSDAKSWKKQRLRDRGVTVIEHAGDYAQAVDQGRQDAAGDAHAHFVDDERSLDLFVGYAAAARQLQTQLAAAEIAVDIDHPLLTYIPCGVGGAPGGIAYGLKRLFGDSVFCFFGEPVAAPCMLTQMAAGDARTSVYDLGLDNRTEADGLAVAQASMLVAPLMRHRLAGIYTATDEQLFALTWRAHQRLALDIEPSAAMAFAGPLSLASSPNGPRFLADTGLQDKLDRAVHVAWTTGGSLVPAVERGKFLERGAVASADLEWA